MASDVDIVNLALTTLGVQRIISLGDNVREAREMNAVYLLERDAELMAHNWKFALKRASLPALADAPLWGFNFQYALPPDFSRLLVGVDQATETLPGTAKILVYRTRSVPDYALEDGKILTDIGAPLQIIYQRTGNSLDTARFHPQFVIALACRLAARCCEALTQNAQKRQLAQIEYKQAIAEAVRADAIQKPPEYIPDDTWILVRY